MHLSFGFEWISAAKYFSRVGYSATAVVSSVCCSKWWSACVCFDSVYLTFSLMTAGLIGVLSVIVTVL